MSRTSRQVFPLLLGLTAMISVGCREKREKTPSVATTRSDLPKVCVANYPLAYFARRIGGKEIEVVFPAPQNEDPAFWQPTDEQVAEYQAADLILMNGATFSKWAEKVTLPDAKVIDTSAKFRDQFIVIKNAVTHSHGKAGEHSHDGTSFTTWIDFRQAIMQADAVAEALKRLKPEAIEEFALNYDSLKKDLLVLDARMEAAGKKVGAQPLVASHPVYHYWARRYGLNLQSVLWEPEEVPTDAQMEDLKKILSSHAARWMIWEGEPAKESVAKLKAIGLESSVFDPCGNVPDSGDFLSVMKVNVENFERLAGK